jgi:hypothetical protein
MPTFIKATPIVGSSAGSRSQALHPSEQKRQGTCRSLESLHAKETAKCNEVR